MTTADRVLECIVAHIDAKGYPPTMAEIGAGAGLRSKSAVSYQLDRLEDAGAIERDRRTPRGIRVLDASRQTEPGRDAETSAGSHKTEGSLTVSDAIVSAPPEAANTAEGWHFLPNDGKLGHGDGRLVVAGEWIEHDGPLEMCRSGLHWCPRAIDSLRYAAGSAICRIEAAGETLFDDSEPDKRVSRRRRALWMLTAEEGEYVLGVHARQSAIDACKYWDPPAIVIRWLETGDEGLRAAAWAAARDAAWDAARDAARDAAWAAARDAAWAAAWDAAWDAAWAAARAAARDAARAAARDAARDAAWAAARDAAWAAAWAAARAAARDAAWDAKNENLERLIVAAHEGRWTDVTVTLPDWWGDIREKAGMARDEAAVPA